MKTVGKNSMEFPKIVLWLPVMKANPDFPTIINISHAGAPVKALPGGLSGVGLGLL